MSTRSIPAVAFSLFLGFATVASGQSTAKPTQSAAGKVTSGKLISLGTTSLQSPMTGKTKTAATHSTPTQIINEPALMKLMYKANANVLMPKIAERAKSSTNASIGYGGSTFTVNGLDNGDSRNVNAGGDLEPPDQGLCAGSGQLLEVINLVFAVYDESGNKISADVSANAFFGVGAEFYRWRFYLRPAVLLRSKLAALVRHSYRHRRHGFIPGGLGRSFVLIAVSDGPSLFGSFNLYAIDTTDDGIDGTPSRSGCLPSALAISRCSERITTGSTCPPTNSDFSPRIVNGAQIYAMSKVDLESGIFPTFVHFGNLTIGGGLAASVHPAQSPAVNPTEPNSGTEFFLNSLNFNGTSDNRIGVWSLTNTSTLNSSPNLFLQNLVLDVKAYEEPGAAQQKIGPYPQGMSLR